MKSVCLLLWFFLFVSSSFSQDAPRKIVSTPSVQPPPEAVESGLGGRVNVQVVVNKTGDVTEVKQVAGPGWICPKVKRSDVQAIQETARTVSIGVKFVPIKRNPSNGLLSRFPRASHEKN